MSGVIQSGCGGRYDRANVFIAEQTRVNAVTDEWWRLRGGQIRDQSLQIGGLRALIVNEKLWSRVKRTSRTVCGDELLACKMQCALRFEAFSYGGP